MVHTCPRCELRFEAEPELSDHMRTDHGVELSRPDPLQAYEKAKPDEDAP